jgi:hypothetical protein
MTTKELREAIKAGPGRRRSPCHPAHCEPASSSVPSDTSPPRRWQRGKRWRRIPAPAAPDPGPAAPAAPLVS